MNDKKHSSEGTEELQKNMPSELSECEWASHKKAMPLRLGREVSDAEAALAYHLGWHCTEKED